MGGWWRAPGGGRSVEDAVCRRRAWRSKVLIECWLRSPVAAAEEDRLVQLVAADSMAVTILLDGPDVDGVEILALRRSHDRGPDESGARKRQSNRDSSSNTVYMMSKE